MTKYLHRAIEPQIWSSVIRSLAVPLEDMSIDVKSLLYACEISADELEHPHGQVPLSRYLNFLNNSAIAADDTLLSIKLTKSLGPELLGALGFLFLSSRNLYDALKYLSYYQNLLQDSTNMRFVQDGDYYMFTYDLYGMGNIDTRLDVEFSLAYTSRLIKLFSDNKCRSLKLFFRHSPSAELSAYQKILQIPCFFNQQTNAIYIHTDDVFKANIRFDESLHQILIDYLDSDLAKKNTIVTFSEQVGRTILGMPSPELISSKTVAKQLGVSIATMYRRLSEEGTSFKYILVKSQYELSCKYLRETKININQISLLLGFSNASSFTRAFVKWSDGLSPKAYRESI
jgi:AraC-like DNA-binding protein